MLVLIYVDRLRAYLCIGKVEHYRLARICDTGYFFSGTALCLFCRSSQACPKNADSHIAVIDNLLIYCSLRWNSYLRIGVGLPAKRKQNYAPLVRVQIIPLLNYFRNDFSFIINIAGRGDEDLKNLRDVRHAVAYLYTASSVSRWRSLRHPSEQLARAGK